MKIMDHYIRLRLSFPNEQHIQHSLQELAAILFCSTKNVKILLKKMSEEKLIEWIPGRGRGNKTEVHFLQTFGEAILPHVEELLKNEKLKEVFLLLKEPLPFLLREKIEERLNTYFGHTTSDDLYDVLKIPYKRKLLPIDPAFAAVTTESHLISQIVDTLVRYNEETDTFEPHLAHTWEMSEDQLTWTFYLRKGVRFHHGKTLSGKDVIFSFERLQTIHSPFTWLTEEITSMNTPSPLQVVFHLRKPNRFFLHYISSVQLSILPHDVIIQNHQYIGTGPFKIKSFTEDHIILEAFPDYFKERALLDRIEFWLVPEQSNIQTNYVLPNMRCEEEKAVETEEIGCIYAAFNFQKDGPQHDIYFRKAWAEIMDPTSLIQDLGGKRTMPAYSFFPDKSRTMYKETSLSKAKEYLQQSTYNGETIHIYFFAFKGSEHDAIWLQKRCEPLGIHLQLHPFPITDYFNEYIVNQADIILTGEVLDADLEMAFLHIFKNKSCFVHRFRHPHLQKQIDKLLDQLIAEPSKEKRYNLIYEIEKILRDQYLLVFYYHVLKRRSFPSSLQNVTIDSFGWTDFAKLWIRPHTQ
ncbi:ABC transporter substrate-binding protein [Bacillus sp. S13(2024)]|uniref:SgrR family transcriptional regulator n=1 Tax=unclassified Bacillus (in: firmicutes) TaxID=185979 RepID=UPI003D1CDB75